MQIFTFSQRLRKRERERCEEGEGESERGTERLIMQLINSWPWKGSGIGKWMWQPGNRRSLEAGSEIWQMPKFAIFAHTHTHSFQELTNSPRGEERWNRVCLLTSFPFRLHSLCLSPFAQFALISAAGAELSLRLRLPAESAPSLPLSLSATPPLFRFHAPHPVLGLSRLRASWPAARRGLSASLS